MLSLDGGPSVRAFGRPLLPLVIIGTLLAWLAAGLGAAADAPAARPPGKPLVEPLPLQAAEQAAIRRQAEALAASLGIGGRAAEPERSYHALDLRTLDETAVTDGAGRTLAVIRSDAASGDLRSVVNLDWTSDADRPRVDRTSAADAARDLARAAGLTSPTDRPDVTWDDPMRAWRVVWQRRIAGFDVLGDGLTVWIHRGGQLAALRRSETPAAAMPLDLVEPDVAADAAGAWAAVHGMPGADLSVAVHADLVWTRPNDFVRHGGADDTDPLVRLTYRVDLSVPLPAGGVHHIALFVDAGSGAVIAGVETA
jgi:hypothetical protein